MKMNVKNFNDWSMYVYEGVSYPSIDETYFYDKGKAESRSFFECMIASVDESANEALTIAKFDYSLFESSLITAITESINNENEDALNEVFGFIQKGVQSALDGAKDLFNKGIEVGGKLWTSVKNIANNIKNVVKAVYEKIKKFLSLSWDFAKTKSAGGLKKIKEFLTKTSNAKAVQDIAKILKHDSTDTELTALNSDLKGTIAKISGKTYTVPLNDIEKDLEKTADVLKSTKSDKVQDIVIDGFDVALESVQVEYLFTTMKGLILEGYTTEQIKDYICEDKEPILNEEEGDSQDGEHKPKRKSLMGWLLEAVGFMLSPFAKLYEKAIKISTNGILTTISAISRGGFAKSYKYALMGSIAALVYHIIHGVSEVSAHLSHDAEGIGTAHESATDKVMIEKDERLITWDVAQKVLLAGLGAVFCKAIKVFFPMVGLILELTLISIASVEVVALMCQMSDKIKGSAFCKLVVGAEHKYL